MKTLPLLSCIQGGAPKGGAERTQGYGGAAPMAAVVCDVPTIEAARLPVMLHLGYDAAFTTGCPMTTTSPRVHVSLSPSLFALVSAMGSAQRISHSQVLRDLLEAAEPALRRVVLMMQAAERAKGSLHEGFAHQLASSLEVLEAELAKQVAMVDGVTDDLVTMAQRVEGKRPGRARVSERGAGGSVQNPPPSNRGVKSPKPGTHRATAQGKP